ncbi:MAG: ferrous iron transport protein A [Phycisphaeraceae bacterium]
MKLATLEPGRAARVVAIDPACRGLARRRLLDLGLTPGAVVRAEFASARRSTVAYRFRQTLVALRHEQAEHITVEPVQSASETRRPA